MNKRSFIATVFAFSAFACAQDEVPEPFRTFIAEAQGRIGEWPEVPVGTKPGEHRLFTVRLDEKPVVVGEHKFACFRFKVPAEGTRDMVWAFTAPRARGRGGISCQQKGRWRDSATGMTPTFFTGVASDIERSGKIAIARCGELQSGRELRAVVQAGVADGRRRDVDRND
jgi:hypothetical protein